MINQQAYERGFTSKCAEHGVDPEDLLKEAGMIARLMEYLRSKFRQQNAEEEPIEEEENTTI